jgi:hypothetical protein
VIFGGTVVAEIDAADADEPALLRAAYNLRSDAIIPELAAAEAVAAEASDADASAAKAVAAEASAAEAGEPASTDREGTERGAGS